MTVSYHYRAATAAGQMVEGTLQAPSRRKVLEDLSRRQLYPVAVDEIAAGTARRVGRRLGRRAALALWTRSAATLLSAGVPLDRALQFTIQHAGHDGLADVLRDVRREVQGGVSLADALERHPRYFPPVFVAMVAAGESSGALDVVLERLSQHLEEVAELRSQIRSALLYPALMAAVASIGVTVLLLFVIPRFATILADVGSTLPLSTRLLVSMSVVLTKGWWCGRGHRVLAAPRPPQCRDAPSLARGAPALAVGRRSRAQVRHGAIRSHAESAAAKRRRAASGAAYRALRGRQRQRARGDRPRQLGRGRGKSARSRAGRGVAAAGTADARGG